jgi:hypothetical protein
MIITIILIVGAIIGGFYYTQGMLRDSINKSKTTDPNNTSTVSNQSIKQLENDIENQKSSNEKAVGLFYSNQDYQSQIKKDLDKYSLDTGVVISGYKAVESPPVGTVPIGLEGVKSSIVSVLLKNPVPYASFIKFLKAIETNLPKMKLVGVNLTNSSELDDSVKVGPLLIEVYTK